MKKPDMKILFSPAKLWLLRSAVTSANLVTKQPLMRSKKSSINDFSRNSPK